MISDSPYEAADLALPPAWGAVIGGAASVLTLAVLSLVEPVTNLEVGPFLRDLAELLPAADSQAAGGVFFVLMGAVLAAFYAASQEQAPRKGLMAVALFYGFFLWAVSGRLLGWMFDETLRGRFRAWGWLLGCVIYSLCLAVAAGMAQARRPSVDRVVPAD